MKYICQNSIYLQPTRSLHSSYWEYRHSFWIVKSIWHQIRDSFVRPYFSTDWTLLFQKRDWINVYFQQDGVTFHTSNEIIAFLREPCYLWKRWSLIWVDRSFYIIQCFKMISLKCWLRLCLKSFIRLDQFRYNPYEISSDISRLHRETNLSPNSHLNWAIASPALWHLAPSCWNHMYAKFS